MPLASGLTLMLLFKFLFKKKMDKNITSRVHNIVNAGYHAAVVSGIAIATSNLSKLVLKTNTPKLALDANDVGLLILNITTAMFIQDYLISLKFIPENIKW